MNRSKLVLLVWMAALAWSMGCATRTETLDPQTVGSRNQRDWSIMQRPATSSPAANATTLPGGKRLAVLEFLGKNLDQDVLMTLSDSVRGGVLHGLEGRGVIVMTRENMLVLLKDMGK